MQKKIAPLALLLLCVGNTPTTLANTTASITVSNAWARETPPGVPNAAAFFVLHNNTTPIQHLVAVECGDLAARCEIHEHVHTNNGMRMQRVTIPLTIPDHGTLIFAPGGYHVMMFDLRKPLHAGENISLILLFDNNSTLSATLPVKAIDEE